MKRLGKLRTLAVASISAVALAAPVVLAQTAQEGQQSPRAERRGGGKGHGGGFGHRGGGGRGGFGFRGVELTDEQKTRVRQIHETHRASTKGLHQQLRAKRQELRQLQEGATFNEALAAQKLTEAAGIEAKLMGEQFRLRQELQTVLTPEQKAQIEQQREQRKQRREQFRGRRGERRGAGVTL
jgi:Spy/CpxP family protein refolding chaperone